MSGGLFVSISSPAAGVTVGRKLLVTGSVAAFAGAVNSMTISFANGGSFAIKPPGGAGRGAGGGLWGWQGLIPNTVRPGQAFSFTITADGTMVTNPGNPEPETVSVDGAASKTLTLEYVVPVLSVDPFQSPIVTTDPTFPFRLSGSLSEAGDPYVTTLTYQVGSAAPVQLQNIRGPWHVDVPLAPGTYPISVTASDNFASSTSFQKTLTVLKYNKPASADPALPKTLVGIPTTSSITSWTRLEPQCSSADMGVTTSARLFDPLWLMTRQWQVGEFQGEDTGTPVQTRVRATNAIISRYHPGELSATNAQSLTYRLGQWPLEALVERRAMRPARATDVRMLPLAVDAGLHFLRMLELDATGAKYRAVFLTKYAMQPLAPAAAAIADADTVRFVATMAGRAPDARLLYTALASARAATFQFDAALGIVAADVAAVQHVVVAWLAYYGGLFTEPANTADNSWAASRLEYAVSVSTRLSALPQDELTLSASEFGGGRLDWSSFDVNGRFKVDTTGDKPFSAITAFTVPMPVTIRGAPAPRFWEMEDAKVAYGLVSAGPTDLAHLMMIEYASSYGNDWYVVPVTLPIGSVTRVDSLVVTDSFGVRSLLRPMGDPALPNPNFSMWQLSALRFAGDARPAPVSNAFFLPPTIGRSLESGPLEDVLFMRDEMANLAWGIERSIEGGMGTAVSLANATPPPPDPAPHYVLSTMAPGNWVPLMPAQVDALGTVQLKRAATLRLDGSTKPQGARSRVLNASTNLTIYDEEIPREGVRITQRRRMVRWIDGSTWVWTAFRNEVGRGEGSAGLRFDQTGDGN